METCQCRICRGPLAHLASYDNMPGGAQHLPGVGELEHDKGICLKLCECSACGVVQLSNAPVSYWRDVIRAVGVSEEMRRFRQEQFQDFVQRHGLRGKKAIELGCGDGAYLKILAQTGMDIRGMEHNAKNVAHCRAQGLNAIQGFPEKNMAIPGSPFAAFFVFSWLEHLPDIPGFLQATFANLQDGAIGLVEVPNFDKILSEKLFAELIRDHLYYFTRESLQRTLETHGFDVISCHPVWHDYILSAEIRKRSLCDISGLLSAESGVKNEILKVYAEFPRVAWWGAGHQALTLMAMAGQPERISYIVDSAPFKQGKFSPVTRRPIVSPDHLLREPVDLLIIACGSYSNEVAEIAARRYNAREMRVFRRNTLEKVKF